MSAIVHKSLGPKGFRRVSVNPLVFGAIERFRTRPGRTFCGLNFRRQPTNEIRPTQERPNMSKSIKEFRKPTHDEISALAQRMYVKEGSPQGKAMEHWLRAEAQFNAERRAEVEAAGAKSS